MGELAATALGIIILLALPLCFEWALRRRSWRSEKSVAAFVALHFFVFHTISALTYGFAVRGWVGLLLLSASSLALTGVLSRASLVWCDDTTLKKSASWPVFIALAMAIAAVSTDWWVFRSQGFDFDTGLSRFAAPFAGDHWRHAAIIAGLQREDQSIFFPDSALVYQVLWHHGAAAILSALPDAVTIFKRELALTLVTGLLMYFCLFDTILRLRPQLLRGWPLLGLVLVLGGTEADIFNAGLTYLQSGHAAFAADSSSLIASPYRYFSLKLVSLTAPQHAVFFMFAALAIMNLCRVVQIDDPPSGSIWMLLRASLVFASMGAVFSPVLAMLVLPFIYLAVFWCVAAFRAEWVRVVRYCAVAVGVVFVLHLLILRMPLWAPFLRPNITGGGSGSYGVKLFPVFDVSTGLITNSPWALASTSGVLGLVVAGLLVWMALCRRSLLRQPLILAFLVTFIFWNWILVDTEIQRHSSMTIAFLGLLVVALYLPWNSSFTRIGLIMIPSVGVCVLLNGYFIRAYEQNAGFMPLTKAWTDYFCMNELVRKKFPGIPLVVATPRHFELPIAVEAAPTLVWSQVATVHQRMTAAQAEEMDALNPRDWGTFRRIGESTGEAMLERMKALGFRGALWGPIEEELYGPALARVFAKPQRFLASCGFVGLYSLFDNDPRGAADPVSAHKAFRRLLEEQPERLLSRISSVDLKVYVAGNLDFQEGRNVAKGAKTSTSGRETAGSADLVVDGLADEAKSPAFLSGNQFLPWWQIDLGATYDIVSVRLVTPRKKTYPQYELKNAYIMLSDHPMSQRSPLSEGIKPGTTVRFVAGEIAGNVVVPVGASGRYLRIQASDQRHLMLTEVEVFSASEPLTR